jgi:hypothetical protein
MLSSRFELRKRQWINIGKIMAWGLIVIETLEVGLSFPLNVKLEVCEAAGISGSACNISRRFNIQGQF